MLALAVAPASAQATAVAGAALFSTHCVACHQADGEGIPGLAPPLVGSLAKAAGVEIGREYIAQVLVSGMAGTIKTRMGNFTGVMPSQSALTDHELAAVATYALSAFNASSVILKAEDIAAARGKPLPPGEVRRMRERMHTQIDKR